jgi:transcriptional regulator with XRE-family HTH domain
MSRLVSKTNVEKKLGAITAPSKFQEETLKEMKEAFLKRHDRNYDHYINDRDLNDEYSKAFGRSVYAARKAKDWTLEKLSELTGLSIGNLLALEAGVFASEDIKPEWVSLIANALEEDASVFEHLLGRIPVVKSEENLNAKFENSRQLEIQVTRGHVYVLWSSLDPSIKDQETNHLHIVCSDSETSDKDSVVGGVIEKILSLIGIASSRRSTQSSPTHRTSNLGLAGITNSSERSCVFSSTLTAENAVTFRV